jgi:hypothetical protein
MGKKTREKEIRQIWKSYLRNPDLQDPETQCRSCVDFLIGACGASLEMSLREVENCRMNKPHVFINVMP